MKKMSQSKTVKVNVGVIASAMVTLILHYTGAILISSSALSMCWTGIIMGALNFLLRMMTVEPIGNNGPPIRRTGRFLLVLGILGVVAGPHLGCGATIRCSRSEQLTERMPDGKVKTVITCDDDKKAVTVIIDKFTLLKTKGLVCKEPQ
jgi:hypothetical protein